MVTVSSTAPRIRAKTATDPNGLGTRERILVAAEELIALRGFEGLALKDIAERVGIRSPSIFAHFDGLDAVMKAVGQRLIERIILSWRPFDIVEAPEKRLRRGVRGLVEHFAQNPATVRMMLRGMSGPSRSGEERERVVAMRAMIAQPIAQLFKIGVAAGEFRPVRVEAFMAHMLGAILVNLVFVGWDENGKLRNTIPLSRLQREAEALAISIVGARKRVS